HAADDVVARPARRLVDDEEPVDGVGGTGGGTSLSHPATLAAEPGPPPRPLRRQPDSARSKPPLSPTAGFLRTRGPRRNPALGTRRWAPSRHPRRNPALGTRRWAPSRHPRRNPALGTRRRAPSRHPRRNPALGTRRWGGV